jgi:hypothetical protein
MIARRDRSDEHSNGVVSDEIPGIHFVTPEEGEAIFDRQARKALGISGAEFLRRWDCGMYRPVPDTPEGRKIGRLVMLIPFARRTKA